MYGVCHFSLWQDTDHDLQSKRHECRHQSRHQLKRPKSLEHTDIRIKRIRVHINLSYAQKMCIDYLPTSDVAINSPQFGKKFSRAPASSTRNRNICKGPEACHYKLNMQQIPICMADTVKFTKKNHLKIWLVITNICRFIVQIPWSYVGSSIQSSQIASGNRSEAYITTGSILGQLLVAHIVSL